LYVAGYPKGSADAEQAVRLQRHLSHPFLSQLVELGEHIAAVESQYVLAGKAPFHALAIEALGEIGS